MARNKHPEETVNLILDTALRLFITKGYERTSIQDIIGQLGGLSKGAIYHHFKSKEDILDAAIGRLTADSNQMLAAIRDRKDLDGKEKLRWLFRESLLRPVQEDIFSMAPDLSGSPELMYRIVREAVELVTPEYVLPIFREGIADGSIRTDYPEELAELIMLTANIWLNPMIFHDDSAAVCRKFRVFARMLEGFGLDVVDGEMIARLEELTDLYQQSSRGSGAL